MYKPVFRKMKVFDGSTMIDIGDVADPELGLTEVHFTVFIKPESAFVRFLNHHTKERVTFKGSSNVGIMNKFGQYSYDVFYEIAKRGQVYDDKRKIGIYFTDPEKGCDYKQFLTGALLRAAKELEKEYGENWLTL